MPLHGKIVVIKRSGGDGTEFPLTASCLFGRKPDCDIRIQLPQVSKEHCRIDLNENKEVILTNLSSVNPTCVNGEALQQAERLKHGDVITIIDRSFRFEYPPAPTPKKRSSIGGKTGKVLQDHQAVDSITTESGEKRISEVSTDPHLKDGTNNDNIQRSLEKTMESKEDDSLLQNKTTSPFNDLYQMIKKSLDVKTPRKSTASLLQTPSSRFCTPKPGSVQKNGGKAVISTEEKSTPKKDEAKVSSGAGETKGEVENISSGTPKSIKKQRRSFQVPDTEMAGPEAQNTAKSEATSPQKRNRASPQRFTLSEVIEQVSTETPKSPMRRRSREATPAKSAVASPKTASPRNSGKVEKVKEAAKKRKSSELAADLPTSQMKKKRVSFGGHLSPELFDKRLPPDSPLRKGATPRRSLSLYKPKQSLLRRASVIGLLQEFDQEHPESPNVKSPAKMRTPSPNKSSNAKKASPKTPSSGKKSPKSRSPSPKAATPAKKSPKSATSSPKAATPAKMSPKSRSPSPKAATPAKKSPKSATSSPKAATAAKKSPKSKSPSPKAATPAKKSPKSRSPSPKAATPGKNPPKSRSPSPRVATPSRNKVETPGVQTPTVQGRFSVSRISTPSPTVEDAVTDQAPSATETPKLPLRRKSMKSTSRKTPSMSKSAVKAVCRRSGISRASMKGIHSWANIVKFGQPKAQVAAPAKKMATKKTVKKSVSKPKTPARKLKDHVSTGHANSPVTIVVGRAHKQSVVYPTGAAPKLVSNIAVFKKDMNMDEDLTGISEMYKTPVNERKRRSVINENSTMKTPVGALGTSVVEPSVLNTPEEPGEMMVSPLSVSSTVKDGRYNTEAVQRLLNGDEESSFISDIPAMETHADPNEQESTDLKMTSVTTPKQKPELPECLTGVKRIMKTPRQMAEPVEDLRGKLLKTPKQKPVQQECLTGVKRIMKTPRQKAEPVEDLRGNILKTPKQKPAQPECLTGVKRIFETPQQEAELLEDLCEKLLETPKVLEAGDASSIGVKEVVETPAHVQESEDLSEMTDMKTPSVKSSPLVCLTGVKRIMKTPKEKNGPVEDMVGVKRLMKTPRENVEPVEENFGIKRLVKTPRLRGNAPVEDFEGLVELMEEPLPEPTGQLETNEAEDQTSPDCDKDVVKELDFAHEEPRNDLPSDVTDIVLQVDKEKEADANEVVGHLEEEPSGHNNGESSDAMETRPHVAVDEDLPVEEPKVDTADNLSEKQPKLDTVDEAGSEEQPKLEAIDESGSEQPKMEAVDQNVSEEQPQVETATSNVSESNATATDPDQEKKPIRGRRAKTVESKSAEDKQETTEHTEDPVVPAPVRGRRGKKTEATAPPAVRQTTRGRKAKTTESQDVEHTLETSASLPTKVALKPKRGRNAKKASDDETVQEVAIEAETVQEVATEAEMMPAPENEQSLPVDVDHKASDSATPLEKAAFKPRQGRKAKQPEQSVPEQQDVPFTNEADTNEVCSDQPEAVPSGSDENKSSDDMETAPQAPATESSPEVETATEIDATVVQKKPVRGRRGKVVESKSNEDKQEVKEHAEEPVVPAPVRGRRGKKTEAAAPPAVRQTKRGRNAKSQETNPDDQSETVAVETAVVTELSIEAESDRTSPVNAPKEENDSVPPTEEAVVKPTRGRKAKQAPVEPSHPDLSDERLIADAQSQQSISTLGKTRRGRKTKPDAVETNEMAEDMVVTVETKQDSQPPVRAKRGRNAKQEEKQEKDVKTTSVETTESQEPVKNSRRTRKADQDHAEQREEAPTVEVVVPVETETPVVEVAEDMVVTEKTEQQSQPLVRAKRGRNAKQEEKVQNDGEITKSQEQVKKSRRTRKAEQDHDEPREAPTVEVVVPVEAEASAVAEPVKIDEQVAVTPKPRRGGRKTKQDTESETSTVSAEVQEVPAVSATYKPKRGKRGKQVTEEVEVTAEVPEEKANHEMEAEEKNNVEPDVAVPKPSRARGVKNEVSQAIPAKRARRGAAVPVEETNAESTAVVSDSAPASVETAKRGRRAAAKPVTNDAVVTSDQANPSEDVSGAVVEDAKTSKRSVKWKADLEVFEIPKATPVRAVRGRKTKLVDQVDTESENASKAASKTEEKDLSDKVVNVQPAKRARRGAKVADEEESTSKSVEAETQPKTRRGRSAKK